MINLRTKAQKRKLQRRLTKYSILFEKRLVRKIRPILGRQYLDVARHLEWGIENINWPIIEQTARMERIFYVSSKVISVFFLNMIYTLLVELELQNISEKKPFKNNFQRKANQWFQKYSVYNTSKINGTTRKRIKRFIDKEKNKGKSLREIATALRRLNKNNRADSIVRTTVHTIMVYSIDTIMSLFNYVIEAEWVSSDNEQVRQGKFSHKNANGERAKRGAKFIRTGEELDFPGDPNGSISNIAHCRCVLCYYIVKKALSKNRRRI